MRVSQIHLATGMWILTAVVLVAGYARLELDQVPRIRASEAEASVLRARIDRSQAILRDRVALRAARKNILADIGEQTGRESGSDLGALLESLDRSVRRTGLAVLAVEPDADAPAPSKDGWLRSRPARLVVRGSFAQFLRFLPELAKADPLILIRNVAIAPAGRAHAHPLLSFTLGVAAYTVRAPASKE